jgi:hypothetical protein
MLGHDYEGDHIERVPLARAFQCADEMIAGDCGLEELLTSVTRERDEVKAVRVRKASEAAWHDAGMVHLLVKSVVACACFIVPTLSPKNKTRATRVGHDVRYEIALERWASSQQEGFFVRVR